MANTKRPFVLIILDGWGYSENHQANAIYSAATPVWDRLWRKYPHTLVSGSGRGVGLPVGQMGNSEVGHLNIGAGRIVHQEFTRIENAIADGEFYANPILIKAIDDAKEHQKAIHVLGLLSPGGVHSHEHQIHTLLKMAAQRGAKQLYLHAFLDGRDTPPQSAGTSLQKLDDLFHELGVGKTASIIGRYYAMDRDQRWERIQDAYDCLTLGKAEYSAESASQALHMAYQRNETDEFVHATTIHSQDQQPITIHDGDSVIFMNYRADRARQLTRAFTTDDFTGFSRSKRPKLRHFVSLTQYAKDLAAEVAFPPISLDNVLGEYIAKQQLAQLRIAETEKYAHVTFFFNGGREQPFPGEDRILINSPNVATYDLQPEMSAPELTDKLVAAINEKKYDLIVCNYANPDMVGHTGNFAATVKAIETIDHALDRIVKALAHVDGELIITADHGNAERMYDKHTKQAHTAHTSEPVPLIYVGRPAKINNHDAALSDIAPTILQLMGLKIPAEMTGKPIITLI